MKPLEPFFTLLGRASVFWLGAFTLGWLGLVFAGMTQPDDRFAAYLSPALMAMVLFPGAAGWLFGLAVQEFEHTSFAGQLPGVRRKVATGFLTAGLLVTLITLAFAWRLEAPFGVPLMFVLGLSAYCAGGTLLDPLSNWITTVNVVVLLFLVARSGSLAERAGDHPWIAATVAVAVGGTGLWRLFSRRTFRLKPFRPTNPLPGRFSLEKTNENERVKSLRFRGRSSRWQPGYFGARLWNWVRAAHHEVHGGLGVKTFLRTAGKLWGLSLIVVISAWIDRGEMSFLRALGYSFYDALFRNPHVETFGEEGGPALMVGVVIAIAGIVTALFKPTALSGALLYPLSRLQRAGVAFRGALADAAMLFLVAGIGVFIVGHVIGLALGFELRFDFMPFHLRVLLVTLMLMPLGHRGRLTLLEATRSKEENTLVGVISGCTAFVILVAIFVWMLPLVFVSPVVEAAFLVGAFVATHLFYRNRVEAYYRTADLA